MSVFLFDPSITSIQVKLQGPDGLRTITMPITALIDHIAKRDRASGLLLEAHLDQAYLGHIIEFTCSAWYHDGKRVYEDDEAPETNASAQTSIPVDPGETGMDADGEGDGVED